MDFAVVVVGPSRSVGVAKFAIGDGIVEFPALRPVGPEDDGYTLTVVSPGYPDTRFPGIRIVPGETLRLTLTLPFVSGRCFIPITKSGCDGVVVPIIRVVDGNTVVVALDDRNERVRLLGVDTPEFAHWKRPVEYLGREAAEYTRDLAEGVTVCLESDPEGFDRESYGRLLRYVYLPDGRLLNGLILTEGYGVVNRRYPFSMEREFDCLEDDAQDDERGLWAERDEEPDE